MKGFLNAFERLAITVLIGMLSIVVVLSIGELGWLIWKDISAPPYLLLEIDELLELFGFFLLILIGMELVDSMRAYLVEGSIHSEVVLTVAVIALARKVIVLEAKDYDGTALIGIGIMFAGLAGAYYIIKRSRRSE